MKRNSLSVGIDWQKITWIPFLNIFAKESIPAAKRVKKELINLAHSLNDFPEKFLIEGYLAEEPEIYRSVHKWNYKIIYEVTDDCIIIADIFQTSQNPSVMTKMK